MPNPGRTVANVQPPPAPAGPRNRRAVSHGATSELTLAPLREAAARELRQDYPHLDGRRLAILADRLARLESARLWLDAQGGVVRSRQGDVFAVVDRIEKWSNTAEQRLAEAEAEARAPRPAEEILAEHLAAKGASE